MGFPEYLSLFESHGDYRVVVIIKDMPSAVAESSMSADEIHKLIDKKTGCFYSKMYFDDWLFDVYKYEIDPVKKILTLKAKKSIEPK